MKHNNKKNNLDLTTQLKKYGGTHSLRFLVYSSLVSFPSPNLLTILNVILIIPLILKTSNFMFPGC